MLSTLRRVASGSALASGEDTAEGKRQRGETERDGELRRTPSERRNRELLRRSQGRPNLGFAR